MRTFRYDTVDSTNERALAALLAGDALDGDVHIARAQTAGRGRLGRRWESPPGEGVYLSLIVASTLVPPVGALTLAAGLAVLDTCAALGAQGAMLDWPNDGVVGDAKLAGILTESRGLDPAAPAWVVGVGLNIDHGRAVATVGAHRAVTRRRQKPRSSPPCASGSHRPSRPRARRLLRPSSASSKAGNRSRSTAPAASTRAASRASKRSAGSASTRRRVGAGSPWRTSAR